MQSFCPRQSTPDPTVGTALAQGFSRCLPEKAPPVLTRTGVVAGDVARLPYKGMEAFCKDHVVRAIVYDNAEEYHNVIAQCQRLDLRDLSNKLAQDVLEEEQLIRFLKWWVRFSKIHSHISTSRSLEIKEKILGIEYYREQENINNIIGVFIHQILNQYKVSINTRKMIYVLGDKLSKEEALWLGKEIQDWLR